MHRDIAANRETLGETQILKRDASQRDHFYVACRHAPHTMLHAGFPIPRLSRSETWLKYAMTQCATGKTPACLVFPPVQSKTWGTSRMPAFHLVWQKVQEHAPATSKSWKKSWSSHFSFDIAKEGRVWSFTSISVALKPSKFTLHSHKSQFSYKATIKQI